MNIRPLFDKVVVEPVKAEEKSKGGIILTAAAQEKPATCVVIAVGPGRVVAGKEDVMQAKPGDQVLHSKYSGTEVKVDGKEYTIIRQSDILAIVD